MNDFMSAVKDILIMHKHLHNAMNNSGKAPWFLQTWSEKRSRKSKKIYNDELKVIAKVTLTHWAWLKNLYTWIDSQWYIYTKFFMWITFQTPKL